VRALCSILFKLDNSLASPPHLWEADEEVRDFSAILANSPKLEKPRRGFAPGVGRK
jgi:hypothetical protein